MTVQNSKSISFGFEPNLEDRKRIQEKFMENGQLKKGVEVLYECDKGCVVQLENVRVSLWFDGRCYVEVLKQGSDETKFEVE
jgi:hypothetical protein